MDWLADIGVFWLNTLAWVAGLSIAFAILGRLMPSNPGMYWWKDLRAAGTDLLYWFVLPLFVRVGRTLMLVVGMALLLGGREPHLIPVQALPLWGQCLAILLLQDVLLYWLHRAFHTRWAWSFHAIHHSPKVLDWTSTTRFHPVNQLLEFALADVVVLLLGFAPTALVVLTPINLIYSALVHANLNWTFGPLRYVFVSPVFHRWHHTTLADGRNKNFASTFPLLDVLFGTFYMPPGRVPEEFGTEESDFPEGFWGQLLHPFRERSERAPQRGRLRPVVTLLAVACLGVMALLARRVYFPAREAVRNELPATGAAAAALPVPRPEVVRQVPPVGHAAAVLGVAISSDGGRIVSGSEDGLVKVWDAATGHETMTCTGHTRPVCGVALSPDGHCLVSGSQDRTVRVWDAATGQEKLLLKGHTGPVQSVALSPDGRNVVSAGWAAAKVWDAATGQEKRTLPGGSGSVLSIAVSADGRRLASACWETVTVWDAETGRELLSLRGHTSLVAGVAVSPDGSRIASASLDQTVKVWDATTGELQRSLTGHAGPVYSVAFSPDGKSIVSGGGDGTVKVWDAATGREKVTLTGHTDAVTSVAVSADGHCLVSGSRDGTLKVWDADQGAFHERAARASLSAFR
jgi:WD40 repeat protein/sterol desaturase/sphingolipid hydroxylase (fatty acid hydroxylase superfamily)